MIHTSEKKGHAGGTIPCPTSQTPHCLWSVQEKGFLETAILIPMQVASEMVTRSAKIWT